MDSAKVKSPCQVCSEPCFTSCGNCGKVRYCSKQHQGDDWKRHRPDCFPGKIVHDDLLGRHLVATRRIEADEVIIKETTLMAAPNGRSGLYPLCLGCCKQMVGDDSVCPKCRWPMHLQCQKNPVHTNECKIFITNRLAPFSQREVHMYEKLFVLRCLLLKLNDPGGWSQVVDLQSHRAARHQRRKGQLLSDSAIGFIHKVCRMPGFTALDIDYVVGVISTNAFVTEDNLAQPPQQMRSSSYLFYRGSFAAHSCIPNGKWSINAKSQYVLRSVRRIEAGEGISQLYGDHTVGTLIRRQHLYDSKYFQCSCPRCADATELGSYFSAIRCLQCTVGNLLPANALDSSSPWNCSSGIDCPVKSIHAIETLLGKIRSEINSISEDNSGEAISALESLLTKNSLVLHDNHYLIHEIEQQVLQRSSSILASKKPLTKNQRIHIARRMVTLARRNLRLVDMICPGLTTHKGRQLYFLQQGLEVVLGTKNIVKRPVPPEIEKQVEEFLEARKLGGIILSKESELREEFVLGKSLQNESELEQRIGVLKIKS